MVSFSFGSRIVLFGAIDYPVLLFAVVNVYGEHYLSKRTPT